MTNRIMQKENRTIFWLRHVQASIRWDLRPEDFHWVPTLPFMTVYTTILSLGHLIYNLSCYE